MLDPPEFILAEKYSQVCKTVALALVYGPILPVSYFIALLGFGATYWTDKYLALRRFGKPARQRNQATYRVVLFMNNLALLQLAAGYVFYDYHQPLAYAAAARRVVLVPDNAGEQAVGRYTRRGAGGRRHGRRFVLGEHG
jgi:hypothetical protein